MTARVLLTGATGFVGRQVLRALEQYGARVTAVVRAEREEDLAPSPAIERIIATPALFEEPADWWAQACDGVDCVVHVAWYAEPGKYLMSPQNLGCLAGTLALAQGAIDVGVSRMVGVGTCFEYNLTAADLSVSTPLNPTTPYAAAKAATYLALSRILPQQGVSFAWCRLFYLYGEGEDGRRLVPYVRAQLAKGEAAELSHGLQVRDFLDVEEAGRRIAAAALSSLEGAINICSGAPITVRELVEEIAGPFGRNDLLRFGDRPENVLDPPRVVGVPTPIPYPQT